MALRVDERIVAGGEGDAVVVHHLVLRGSNRAIGRHLGEIARRRYGLAPVPASGPPSTRRIRRESLRADAPALSERARGAADAFGVDPADDALDLARLGAPPPCGGCGAIFLPPSATAHGRPLVSRALDGIAVTGRAPPGSPPGPCRPYVLETYPDTGHAALAVVACDLLGCALDGVNAAGLCVAWAPDAASAAAAPAPEPAAAGLDPVQLGRVLLDQCATAEDARAFLLGVRLDPTAPRALWLVADRRGTAFAVTTSGGRARLVAGAGTSLVLTNHAPGGDPGGAGLPTGDGPAGTYARYRALRAALAEAPRPGSAAALAAIAARAFAGAGASRERTLWHGIYDPEARALDATFFLRDAPDPVHPGALRATRTPPLRFRLDA
jgi:hypothetical protein